MKLLALVLAFLLALACLVAGGGCAAVDSPTQRWAIARQSLTTVQDTVLPLHAAGAVSDDELLRIDVIVQTARRALAVAESQLPDGGTTFDQWLAIARGGLDALADIERRRIESMRDAGDESHGDRSSDRGGAGGDGTRPGRHAAHRVEPCGVG
jgi:hypothetical protein